MAGESWNSILLAPDESLAMLAALHFGRLAEHDGATDPSGPRIDAVELARTCSQSITLAEPAGRALSLGSPAGLVIGVADDAAAPRSPLHPFGHRSGTCAAPDGYADQRT